MDSVMDKIVHGGNWAVFKIPLGLATEILRDPERFGPRSLYFSCQVDYELLRIAT